jgi:hypothetical protein
MAHIPIYGGYVQLKREYKGEICAIAHILVLGVNVGKNAICALKNFCGNPT